MSFVIDPKRPLQDSLVMVARSESAAALQQLQGADVTSVHQTRKHLKRLRAWLRLLKPWLDTHYPLLDRLLRDAARQLAGRRDLDVAVETLRSLRRGRQLAAEPYQRLRAALAQMPPPLPIATAQADARMLITAAQWYLMRLTLPPLKRAALREALAQQRARCQRDWQRARAAHHAVALHDSRKSIKQLATLQRLLAPRLAPGETETAALTALGEQLGRHHDLYELRGLLDRLPLAGQELMKLRVRDRIDARMAMLERDLLAHGDALFA